jgi:hypothetical protein
VPQTTVATADNPFQKVIRFSDPGPVICLGALSSAGATFALTRVSFVTLSGSVGRAHISPVIKEQNGGSTTDATAFEIPLDADDDGDRAFDFVVRPNSVATAAPGDILGLDLCVEGTNMNFTWILTGQRVASPTVASVNSFDATSGRAGATLRWRTASETEILGFNVWRYRGAKGVKLNRTLIRAKRGGEPAGASYRYVDQVRGAKRGLTYRLQLVDLKGKRTWYAAFAIASK